MLDYGLIFGGFNPFHFGHLKLIETGLKEVQNIDIYIGRKPTPGRLPYEVRRASVDTVISSRNLRDRLRLVDSEQRLFQMDTSKYDALIVGSDFLCHMDPKDRTFKEKERYFVNSYSTIVMQEREGFPLSEGARKEITQRLIEYSNGVPHSGRAIRSNHRNKETVEHLLPRESFEIVKRHMPIFFEEI